MAWLGGQRQVKAVVPAALEVDTPRPSSVTLYAEHPKGEITIEEFEICALDRLKGTLSVHPACSSPCASECYCCYFASKPCRNSVRAVLKGLEDAKARGKKGEDMQVLPSAMAHRLSLPGAKLVPAKLIQAVLVCRKDPGQPQP